MKFRANLLWKVILPFEIGKTTPWIERELFNVQGGKTFVRSLGGDFRLEHAPSVLRPTDRFHKSIKELQDFRDFYGNRFPYQYRCPISGESRTVNISIHHHADILCLTIRLAPFDVEGNVQWHELMQLTKNEVLWPLTKLVLSLATRGTACQRIPRQPQVYPALHVHAIEGDLPDQERALASIVTGHPDVNAAVATSVFKKNESHRIDSTTLLIDKQGVASYVPQGVDEGALRANMSRFEVASSMLQLAAVTRLQLRRKTALSDDILTAISHPKRAIPASVSGLMIWSLIKSEFALETPTSATRKSANIMRSVRDTSSSSPNDRPPPAAQRIRVLFITVTPIESRALHSKIREVTGTAPATVTIGNFSYKSLGTIGNFDIIHQISGMGSGGLNGSQEIIRRSILETKPYAVIMVGIAFGVDPSKQKIGTILISNQIQHYDLQRINKDSSLSLRGDKVTASSVLLNWVAHTETDWPENKHQVTKGLILSGDKLIDNLDYRNEITSAAPESIGGEMEGAGLYVASQSSKVEWLLIKSVCDWADGNKSINKSENQREAAESAAEFATLMLKVNSNTRAFDSLES